MKKKTRRITTAILAAVLCASPVLNTNSGIISSIMPVNTFTASATTITKDGVKYELYTDGTWQFYINNATQKTATIYRSLDYKATSITMPGTVTGPDNKQYTVTAFDRKTFGSSDRSNTKLTSVSLPKIKKIESESFRYVKNLTEIKVTYGLEEIGDLAFVDTKLKSFTWPSSLKRIGRCAFEGTSLESVGLYRGLETIGESAFEQTLLKSVTIPNTVTSIGSNAFSRNSELTSVEFRPGGKTSIGTGAFSGTGLTSIVLPSGMTEIADNLFYSTKLTTITIPSTVTSIGSYAFANCTSLSSIDIPSSVTLIGKSAFVNTALSSVDIPSSVTEIGNYAFSNTPLKSVVIPGSVKAVKSATFKNCTSLKSVAIKQGVRILESYAFENTPITSINIPSSVITYNDSLTCNTFKGCDKLENFVMDDATFVRCADLYRYYPNVKKRNYVDLVSYNSNGQPFFNSANKQVIMDNYSVFEDQRWYKVPCSFMNEYIDAYVKYVVKTETAGCTTEEQKVRKLHDWICNKVEYAPQNEIWDEKYHTDGAVFMLDYAVCEGYSRGFQLLLQEAGIKSYLVISGDHSWNIVQLGDKWYNVDVTHDDSAHDYSHYLKSDSDIKKCPFSHGGDWFISMQSSRFNYKNGVELPECNESYPLNK